MKLKSNFAEDPYAGTACAERGEDGAAAPLPRARPLGARAREEVADDDGRAAVEGGGAEGSDRGKHADGRRRPAEGSDGSVDVEEGASWGWYHGARAGCGAGDPRDHALSLGA